MKTAIYITDNTTQIVLTPENDFDKLVVERFKTRKAEQPVQIGVRIGEFYECRGGWFRQGSNEDSLMLGINLPERTVNEV